MDSERPPAESHPHPERYYSWDDAYPAWHNDPHWHAAPTEDGANGSATEERFPPANVAAYEAGDPFFHVPYAVGSVNGAVVTPEGNPAGVAHPYRGARVYSYPDAWAPAPPSAPEAAAEPGTDWKALVHELLETAVLTLLIFVLMRALIQNYRIEGYSMEPNLHEQQYLIVNKVAYYVGEPQRGDIIVFEYPKGDPNGPERDYIKRIIGLPGDTVECRPNEILVNGRVIEEPYGPNPWSYSCAPTTLGPDEYFVLGDNRPQSSDSHQWGPLERKYIIGKAWLSYWPLESWGRVPNYPLQAPEPRPTVAQTP